MLESAGQAVEQQIAEQLGVQDAAQQVRLLLAFADRLELPRAFLASRELMERGERELGRVVREGQAKAQQARMEGLRRLVKGPAPIALSDVEELVHQTDCWVDTDLERGRLARAVDLAMTAARMARGEAYQAAVAESSGFYGQLQKIAGEMVKEIAKLKPLPRQVWGAADAPGLMIREGRGGDWAVMVMAQERFSLVHQAGQVVRRMGGLGAAGLLNGPPEHLAFAYRRWDLAAAGEIELRRLHPGLKLSYAIREKWEPGLWLAGDVPPRPALEQPGPRRGLVGLLMGPKVG